MATKVLIDIATALGERLPGLDVRLVPRGTISDATENLVAPVPVIVPDGARVDLPPGKYFVDLRYNGKTIKTADIEVPETDRHLKLAALILKPELPYKNIEYTLDVLAQALKNRGIRTDDGSFDPTPVYTAIAEVDERVDQLLLTLSEIPTADVNKAYVDAGLATKVDLITVDVLATQVEDIEGHIDTVNTQIAQVALSVTTKENTGVASGLLSAHLSEPDPHGQYVLDTDSRLSDARLPIPHSHGTVTSSTPGFMLASDFVKLAGIQEGATENSPDSYLLNRGNHEGTQPIETVTGLQTALDSKETSGTASSLIGQHLSASDPHSQYVLDTDDRLSDARVPLSHTHTVDNVSGLQEVLNGKASLGYVDTGLASKVNTNDPRLSDSRTPVSHGHGWGDLSGVPTTVPELGLTDVYTKTEVDSLVSDRLQVFGTPLNGLVPKWNATSGRAEWAPDEAGSGSGGTAGVTSFNGRSGVVTPQASDYGTFYAPATVDNGFGFSVSIDQALAEIRATRSGDLEFFTQYANERGIGAYTPWSPRATWTEFGWDNTTKKVLERVLWQVQTLGGTANWWEPVTTRIASSEKGQANGVATLGADGKVPSGQLPAFTIGSGSIGNTQISDTAAIAWSKVDKTGAMPSDIGAATASQGAKADTALQPGFDLSTGSSGSLPWNRVSTPSGLLSVSGTPTNGQVPKWNSATSQAEWSNDLEGSGGGVVTAYKFIQNGIPSSPANGDRWLELGANGLPVEGWFYEGSVGKWLSIDTYSNSSFLAFSSSTDRDVTIPIALALGTSLWVDHAFIRGRSGGNHSGSSYFNFKYRWVNAGFVHTDITSTFSTAGVPSNTWFSQRWDVNQEYETLHFRLNSVKVGSPANCDTVFGMVCRKVRLGS